MSEYAFGLYSPNLIIESDRSKTAKSKISINPKLYFNREKAYSCDSGLVKFLFQPQESFQHLREF